MARGEGDFASIAVDPRWRQLSPTEHVRPWTDDFSNLLGAVDWAALGRQLVDAATR